MTRPTDTHDFDGVDSRESLHRFVCLLIDEIDDDSFENDDLRSYLTGLEGWIHDMPGALRNSGLEVPDQPSWSLVARMLAAATLYE